MKGGQSLRMVLLGCILVLAGLFSEVRPAAAQAEVGCQRPEGIDEAPSPSITAAQVEADPTDANLKALAVEARDYVQDLSILGQGYAWCILRRDGGDWKSESVYLVQLTADGSVSFHGKDMAFGGRQLRDEVFLPIVMATGLEFSGTNPATGAPNAMFTNPDGGALPQDLGGHAVGYLYAPALNTPFIVLAGFDIHESHLKPVVFDPADTPDITASDVVDRDTLKAFVNGAIDFLRREFAAEGISALVRMRSVFRQEGGPWRDGSVYLYVLDTTGYVWFHAAFPNLYELTIGGGAQRCGHRRSHFGPDPRDGRLRPGRRLHRVSLRRSRR